MDAGTRPAAQQAKPITNMRVTLWGVQGSCPIFPSPEGVREYSRRLATATLERAIARMRELGPTIRIEDLLGGEPTPRNIERLQAELGLPPMRIFGGETTSIEIETSEGDIILLDAGSGIRRCSFEIARRRAGDPRRSIHLFGSHEHLDHRVGLTFARFLYSPDPYDVHVYGPGRFLMALDQHYGIFSRRTSAATYFDDPVDYTMMTARFSVHEFVRKNEPAAPAGPWPALDLAPLRVGSTLITPFEVCHPVPMCLGYRIEHNGKTFIYATDHELRHGPDANDPRQLRSLQAESELRSHCQGADLAYFDGQYTRDEYDGKTGIGDFPPLPRMDWGHGCIEDIVERTRACGIRQTFIGHHDPERSWTGRIEMDRQLRDLCGDLDIKLADGDGVIDL